jgi:hypothetical protein
MIRISQKDRLNRDLNPGPPAPKAGIIPLDQRFSTWDSRTPRAVFFNLFEVAEPKMTSKKFAEPKFCKKNFAEPKLP